MAHKFRFSLSQGQGFLSLPDALSEEDIEKLRRLIAAVDRTTIDHADVVLTGVSPNCKIDVIKAIREVSGWGSRLPLALKEANDLAENVPSVVCTNVPHEEAKRMRWSLQAAGGTVTLRQSST